MSKNTSSSGMGLLGVLQIIFIVLKCVGTIDWPWRKVLIPLWIELGLFALLVLCYIAYYVYYYVKEGKRW